MLLLQTKFLGGCSFYMKIAISVPIGVFGYGESIFIIHQTEKWLVSLKMANFQNGRLYVGPKIDICDFGL